MNYTVQLPLWYAIEKNENGITLCGSVARHVAEFLGRRIPQGENPWLLKKYYTENYGYLWEFSLDTIPRDAYLLDIFLTSNTESWKEWGHRVIAEKIQDAWVVYDPFFEVENFLLKEYKAKYEQERGSIVKIHAYS
jgi:hypothetical protein